MNTARISAAPVAASTVAPEDRDPRRPMKLVACLAAVYLIWGSSFVFTKIAVTHLPLALYAAIRFLTAGTVLSLVARFAQGQAWPRRAADWRHACVAGFFMVFLSNGLNGWALETIPTNESALLNGTAAFWIAGLGVWGPRGHPLSRRAVGGLVVGFLGTALMLIPDGAWRAASLLAELGVLAACLAFSVGTLYYRNAEVHIGSLMFMGMQLGMGGLMLLAVALVRGDAARWTFDPQGILALTYLTFASSCLTFAAYGWLTRHTTPAVIGSYSYVNPAIAAYLGWQFMGENLSRLQLLGMLIIIIGVAVLTLPGGGFSAASPPPRSARATR